MGTYLDKPNKEKNIKNDSCADLQYYACGMQGWRQKMEDGHITELNFLNKYHVFGVFDGHGGDEVSKACEKFYKDVLSKQIAENENDLKKALKQSFVKMDEGLQKDITIRQYIGQVRNEDKIPRQTPYEPRECDVQSGSTANVLLINGNKLYIANAGDSRCVIFRNDPNPGKRYQLLSFDHKPDQEMEKERIVRAGGGVYDGRVNGNLNLSRAIGDFEYKGDQYREADEQLIIPHPDLFEYTIQANDICILMGCDGIWETWKLYQISDFLLGKLKNNENPAKILEDYLEGVIAKDIKTGVGCDNMTAILILLKK